jgi:tetratricopeptide (TPR) repeat protein
MNYDLFISYARADNRQGQIAALVAEIERDFNRVAGRPMRTFFDTQEIKGMHDWRDRILEGLRESGLLLVCLSPNYLKSEYCEWELTEFLKHEASRGFTGSAVAPAYLAEIPDWGAKDYDRQCADWVRELRRRQYFDLRAFHTKGPDALADSEVETHFRQLPRRLWEQIKRVEASTILRGNVDRPNPHFQGRQRHLRELHQALHRKQVGMLAAVQGVGGLGKTALALEYAHAFGYEYGGGRWQVRCEGRDDLRLALASLEPAIGIQFTQAEAADLDLQFARVLDELHQLAEAVPGASRCLLILDNVDRTALLSLAQTQRLPPVDWLHVIVTTRLNQDELDGQASDRQFLAVDELPEDEGLDLIESYQPGARFSDETERDAALGIVRLLGGFTLAVENAAIFLAQRELNVTCAGFLARLQSEGLSGLEALAASTKATIQHGEKLVGATLAPTLELLSPEEMLVLRYAALLPADQIALPWLRVLVTLEFPELGADAEPGYPDPWLTLLRRLLGLRLLKPSEVTDGEGRLLVVRMHRVVQHVVQARFAFVRKRFFAGMLRAVQRSVQARTRFTQEELLARLVEHVVKRCKFVRKNEHVPVHRWELEPLRGSAEWLLEEHHPQASLIANDVGMSLVHLARFSEAEPLMRLSLANDMQDYGPELPNVATHLNNLAHLLQETNRRGEAELLMRRALAIDERRHGPKHPAVATSLNNLAQVLQNTDRLEEAEPLMRRALAIDEQHYGPGHPNVATDLSNLAWLLRSTNRLVEAEPLMKRVVRIFERTYGWNHPRVAVALNNLAQLLKATNRLEEAEVSMLMALAIDEQCYGKEHPNVAVRLNNLAGLLRATNRLGEAEPLGRRHLEIFFKFKAQTGHEHPNLQTAIGNYSTLLSEMGKDQAAIRAELNQLGGPFGISFGDRE